MAIFSFKFHRRKSDGVLNTPPIGEYIFLNGPTAYTEKFAYRISHHATFGGGTSITDYGRGNGSIQLQGEFYRYFIGRVPEAPGSASGIIDAVGNGDFGAAASSAGNAASNRIQSSLAEAFPVEGFFGQRSGETEFFDFINLLHSSRIGGDELPESTDEQAQNILLAIHDFNYADFGLVWVDYDRGREVEVMVPADGLQISRSVEDHNTYYYNLNLIVIRDRPPLDVAARSSLEQILAINPLVSVARVVDLIETAIRLPLELTGKLVQVSEALTTMTSAGSRVVDAFESARGQFAADGRLIRSNFQASRDNLEATFQRGSDKETTWEKQINGDDESDVLDVFDTGIDAQLREAFQDLYRSSDAMVRRLIQLNVAPTVDVESAALLPGADFTAAITSPGYEQAVSLNALAIQGLAALKQAEMDWTFETYYVNGGETWATIAENQLGDASDAAALASYNQRSVFANPAGTVIKLPGDNLNAVFAQIKGVPDGADYERAQLGEDLALTEFRDFDVAPNGDLAIVEGSTTLANNLIDLIDTPVGSLPLATWWGNPIQLGESVNTNVRQVYLAQLLSAIRSDPRVRKVRLVEVAQNGNEFTYRIQVESIFAGNSFFIKLRSE